MAPLSDTPAKTWELRHFKDDPQQSGFRENEEVEEKSNHGSRNNKLLKMKATIPVKREEPIQSRKQNKNKNGRREEKEKKKERKKEKKKKKRKKREKREKRQKKKKGEKKTRKKDRRRGSTTQTGENSLEFVSGPIFNLTD